MTLVFRLDKKQFFGNIKQKDLTKTSFKIPDFTSLLRGVGLKSSEAKNGHILGEIEAKSFAVRPSLSGNSGCAPLFNNSITICRMLQITKTSVL